MTLFSFAGKNPVFVDPTYDVKTAAKRILWGRFSNAGQVRTRPVPDAVHSLDHALCIIQICLAPEYVLVPADFQDTLVATMKEV